VPQMCLERLLLLFLGFFKVSVQHLQHSVLAFHFSFKRLSLLFDFLLELVNLRVTHQLSPLRQYFLLVCQ